MTNTLMTAPCFLHAMLYIHRLRLRKPLCKYNKSRFCWNSLALNLDYREYPYY